MHNIDTSSFGYCFAELKELLNAHLHENVQSACTFGHSLAPFSLFLLVSALRNSSNFSAVRRNGNAQGFDTNIILHPHSRGCLLKA